MLNTCPLCSAASPSVWARVSARDLERIYLRAYDVRIVPLTAAHDELRLMHCAACDLKFFDPAIAGDVAFYEALESFDWYYTKSKPEFDLAARFVAAGDRVLEVGCGAGHFGKRLDRSRYVGLELTAFAAQAARSSGLDVRQETLEAHAAGAAGAYDVVCFFQVLEHIPQPGAFLRHARRCLRAGGRLIASVPAADGYIGRAPNNCLNLPPHHVTWWSDAALGNLAALLDLKLEHLEHEPLADEHVEAYAHTQIWNKLLLSGAAPRPVDLSFAARVRHRLALLALPLVKRRVLAGRRPSGHSVTAIYRAA
jgi:SAM-dependent methyltransferase